MTGLNESDAETYCKWLGKRLPSDAEWAFMATDRGVGQPLGLFPFDDVGANNLGCKPTAPGLAVNYRAEGIACPRNPMPVHSYPSSDVTRGDGAPLADVSGNVYEWTREMDGDTLVAAILRGGGYDTPYLLLQNAFPIRLVPGAPGYEADRARLSVAAGFRCAADERIARINEPACPAESGVTAP